MKRVLAFILTLVLMVCLFSCTDSSLDVEVVPRQNEGVQTDEPSLMPDTENETDEPSMVAHYTMNTKIEDVKMDPVFGGYGRKESYGENHRQATLR